jgi:tetratricopeptide (TPR) repeat protein
MAASKRSKGKSARRKSPSKRPSRSRGKQAKSLKNKAKPASKKKISKKRVAKKATRKPSVKKVARKKAVTKKKAAGKKKIAKKKVAKKKVATKKRVARKATRKPPVKKKVTKKKAAMKKKAAGKKKVAKKAKASVKKTPVQRRRLSTFNEAVKIYEAAVRLMHAEKFEEARSEFDRLIVAYPAETELVDRANVLIQACENRLQEAQAGPRLKGANDYYEVGVAEMNNGALDEAKEHLEHALQLLPTADHVLYALGALAALRGEREVALDYLSRSIERREENRFLAVNDVDFESLAEDPAFLDLVSAESS